MREGYVSIIMPAYNVEQYIAQAIESVINQTYADWELLVMDDCSQDNTWAIISAYAQKDNRIKAFQAPNNRGVVTTRNELVDIAIGEYVAFLDSDDYWHSLKLEKQIQAMEVSGVAISCTSYIRVDKNNQLLNEIFVKNNISYTDMLKNNYLGCSTVMLNSKKLGKKYFPQLDKNEDYVLWLAIIKETQEVLGVWEPLVFYRVLNASRSSNKFMTAKIRWNIYRNFEQLSRLKSIYYFLNYIINALKKNKFKYN